jgi:phage terminase small subunit/phage terminase Nu1 subunit (DNA packaging protein)
MVGASGKSPPSVGLKMIEAPLELSPEAVAEWDRLVAGKDELSDRDRGVLAAYCQAHGRWKQAERALAAMAQRDAVTSGLMIKNKAGNAIENPLVGIANRAMVDMARFAAALSGVLPSGAEGEPASAIVSQAEFARAHGVSRKTVTKWKAEGRLVLAGGEVDVAATDARLFAAGLGRFRAPVAAAGEPGGEAKRRYTQAQAELKELELAEKRGQMVSVEDVAPILADELANVRSRLMAMPGRLAVELAAVSDAAAIERLITHEIAGALSEITQETAARAA